MYNKEKFDMTAFGQAVRESREKKDVEVKFTLKNSGNYAILGLEIFSAPLGKNHVGVDTLYNVR